MKKTFTINIGGSIFHIDDDAFEKLQNYLHLLNKHFNTAVEGQEIIQDIEARISELFLEKTQNKVEVITIGMVDEIIARMGKPEDFMEPEPEETSTTNRTEEPTPNKDTEMRRRLYRDKENRILGGVCSGIGAYFNVDPVIIRVLFVVLLGVSFLAYIILLILLPEYNGGIPSGGQSIKHRLYRDGDNRMIGGICSGLGAYFNIDPSIFRVIFVVALFMGGASFLVYLILWIVVPKAKTTTQKLEMRGKEATVTNIAQSVKEEGGDVKDNNSSFGDNVGNGLRVVLRILIIIFGAVLIISGIASLIGFITTLAVGHSFLHGGALSFGWNSDINLATVLDYFVSPGAYTLTLITIAILVGIPILMVLFIGTKLLFRYQTNNKLIGLGAIGLWLAALIVLIFVVVNQAGNFGKQTSQTITQKVDCSTCKTLYLELNDDLFESLIENDFSLNRMKIATINGKEKLLGHPRFTIEKSSTNEYLMLIKKRARGSNSGNAQQNVEDITYTYSLKDSTLHFDPYYSLKEAAKWRDQEVFLTLKVPEGKSVYLNPQMKEIIYDIENVENMWDGDMVDKTWTMTPEGLALKKAEANPVKEQTKTNKKL